MIVISNVHSDLYTSSQNYVSVCNKHMGAVDMLDSNVGVYRLDVRGKKWYWSFYINTVNIFKSAAFKSFKLVHPDD